MNALSLVLSIIGLVVSIYLICKFCRLCSDVSAIRSLLEDRRAAPSSPREQASPGDKEPFPGLTFDKPPKPPEKGEQII